MRFVLQKIFIFFSNPLRLAFLNSILLGIAVFSNLYFQVFCVPVLWALCLLIVVFLAAIFSSFPSNRNWQYVFAFMNGVGTMVFLYCILFLEFMSLSAILLTIVGIGFIILIPQFFVAQFVYRYMKKGTSKLLRACYFAGIGLSVIILILFGIQYHSALKNIENFQKSKYQVLDKNYFTERILGMHFIYHTEFCPYDGWRPPKHDPALIIGLWFHQKKDPLNVELTERLALYKAFYPDNKFKFNCSCALSESKTYHNDPLWK